VLQLPHVLRREVVDTSFQFEPAKNLAMWEDRIEAMERDFYLEEYKSKQLNNFIEERWHWND